MTGSVKLLSEPINFAVVQLPERQHPGIVVQGDTLNGLVSQLTRMKEQLKIGDLTELKSELDEMSEILGEALNYYRVVCAKHSIS